MLKFLTIAIAVMVHANIDLNAVRSGYTKAVDDKKLCSEMIHDLKSIQANNLCLAYLGGYQCIWAKHVFNPFSKLKTFNEGKNNIEKAVKNEPLNPEIRLVRLSVQKNAPSFLRYGDNVQEDESFIRKNIGAVNNPVLLKMTNELLKK